VYRVGINKGIINKGTEYLVELHMTAW